MVLRRYLALIATFSIVYFIFLINVRSVEIMKVSAMLYMWTPAISAFLSGDVKKYLGKFSLKYYIIGGVIPLIYLALTFVIFFPLWSLSITAKMVNLLIAGIIAGFTVNAIIALGEEIGWRGLMYEELKGSLFKKSVIIGIVWALWHWPLFALGYLNYPTTKIFGLLIAPIVMIPMTYLMLIVRERDGVYAAASFHGVMNGTLGLAYLALASLPDWLRPPAGLLGAIPWVIMIIVYYLGKVKIES